ncbi:MAG: CDP-alcohol phosphatidyltransferase family protein [bacterium]|nr:CDP-alcohol phosphatidyltransferase family protein [bacterium]
MFSVYQLKTGFQNLLRPITNFLAKINVTANMVTILAFILSLVIGIIIYLYSDKCKYILWILPIFLLVRMALNAIDGMLAREHNQKSNLGAIYNELGDILSDTVIYVPFLYVLNANIWLNFIFAILAIITETVGIMGVQINASRRYDGPMGKSDRAFWVSILAIASMYVNVCHKCLCAILSAMIFFLCITIINRIVGALKEAK